MRSWDLVLWGVSFLGETHGWVVARIAEAWAIAGSAREHVVAADLGVQILVAVLYIAIGVWLALHAKLVGAPAVVWYDRVAIAASWLPVSAFMLGLWLVMMAYMFGGMIAFYAVSLGLIILPYEVIVRGILALWR